MVKKSLLIIIFLTFFFTLLLIPPAKLQTSPEENITSVKWGLNYQTAGVDPVWKGIENITYTPSSETHCIGGKCWTVLYSGIRYIYEDNTWKPVEKARSLKGYYNVIYLEKDERFDIEVIDFNYTWIKIRPILKDYRLLKKNLSVKLLIWNKTKTEGKSWKEFYYPKKSKLFKFKILTENLTIEFTKDDGFSLGSLIQFGENSTTIQLQDADTENLEDTYIDGNNPDTNYGSSTTFDTGSNKKTYFKFNLSVIPSGNTITDSVLKYSYLDDGSTTVTWRVYQLDNQTWVEENPTWNNPVIGEGDLINTTTVDPIVTGATLNVYHDVTSWVSNCYNNNYDNVSFLINTTTLSREGYTKEYSTIGKRPYLNITYVTDTPPTYSDNSTNSTYAGEPVEHRLKWQDEIGLSGYIFSFDNCTGTFVNDTWTEMTGTGNWSNVTKVTNSTVGCTIRWKVYANDTSNNWNVSVIYSYILLDGISPTYSLNSTNTTVAGSAVEHRLKWEDNRNLGGYVFSWYNGTNWTKYSNSGDLESGEQSFSGEGEGGGSSSLNAEYNNSIGAPECSGLTGKCIANSSLLECAGNEESNYPNTVDACTDGTSGSCHSDESTENITVRSLNHSTYIAPGDTIEITAWVYCWSDGSSDNINFVYTDNADSPSWTVIHTIDPCPGGGFQKVSYNYTISNNEGRHVIRVITEYNGNTADTCGDGSYDDNDDLVFKVGTGEADQDANKTPVEYQDVISNLYEQIDNITVTVNVSAYDNSGSQANGNANPTLWLEVYNGSDWVDEGDFQVSGTGNYSITITTSSILQGWETEANRDIRISVRFMDFNDQINWTDVWVKVYSQQEFLNDSWQPFKNYLKGNGIEHKFYKGSSSSQDVDINAGSELSEEDYNKVKASDDNRAYVTATINKYPFFRYNFSVGNANKFKIYWEGYQAASPGQGVRLKIYNFSSSAWVLKNSSSCYSSDCILIYVISGVEKNDFIENNTIHILVYSSDNSGTSLYVDATYLITLESNESWSNVTKVITSQVGATIKWKVYANDTSDNWNVSDTYSYVTTSAADTTPPTIEFISQTPSNLNESSTEPVTIIVNITDESGINLSKVAFFTGVNHTLTQDFYHYNWSWRYPANDLQPDMRRADNRNMSYWFEDVVFKESPDDIWTFAGYDNSTYEFEVLDSGDTYYTINVTFFSAQMMFPQIFPFDKMYLTAENKTGQYVELHKNNWMKIKFYPSVFYNYTTENYTIYIDLNVDPDFTPNTKPLEIFFCNSSYTTGDPLDSDYCVYVEDIDATDTRTIVINQSSYIQNIFYISDGYIDGVKVSDEAYLVLRTTVPSVKAFRLYYADDEINQYINFTDFNNAWVSTDDGDTWNLVSYTPDFYLISTQGERDKVMYYVYACDNLDNCGNSSMQYDSLDPINHPPAEPLITKPEENESVIGLYNITWLTIGDPDFDSFNASVYLCNPDGSVNTTLADNNITGSNTQYEYKYEVNFSVFPSGKYRINVTLCDIYGLCSSSLTAYNFTVYHHYIKEVQLNMTNILSVTRISSMFRKLIGSFKNVLKLSRIGNFFRSLPQEIKLTAEITKLSSIIRRLPQTIKTYLSIDRMINVIRSKLTDISVTNQITRMISVIRNIPLSVLITAEIIRIRIYLRSIPLNVLISEEITRAVSVIRSIPIQAQIEITIKAIKILVAELSQSIKIVSDVSRKLLVERVLQTTINVEDIIFGSKIVLRHLSIVFKTTINLITVRIPYISMITLTIYLQVSRTISLTFSLVEKIIPKLALSVTAPTKIFYTLQSPEYSILNIFGRIENLILFSIILGSVSIASLVFIWKNRKQLYKPPVLKYLEEKKK